MSDESQLSLPDGVRAAAEALPFAEAWKSVGPGCWICSLEDATNALKKKGFSSAEAKKGIDWHLQGGRISIVVPPSWSDKVSRARQTTLETTPLWLEWLQQQDLKDGPIPPNRFRYGDKEIELSSRLYWLAASLWKRRERSYEDLIDQVWQGATVTDGAIRAAASNLGKKFLEASMPITVATKAAHVILSVNE